MTKKRILLSSIAVVLAVSVLAAGAYAVKVLMKSRIERTEKNVARHSKIADWQIYRNAVFGYEVAYPRGWDVTTQPITAAGARSTKENRATFRPSGGNEQQWGSIVLDVGTNSDKDWKEFILQYEGDLYEERDIAGWKGLESLVVAPDGGFARSFMFADDEGSVLVTFELQGLFEKEKEMNGIFDEMLGSFRFIR